MFLYTKVYNETADQRVGFDGGSLRGLMLQLITDFLDLVIGEEIALFFKWDVFFKLSILSNLVIKVHLVAGDR